MVIIIMFQCMHVGLMKGDHDDNLIWPVKGALAVSL